MLLSDLIKMENFKKNQKGFAVFFITILIMAVVFGIAVSIFILTYGEQKIIKNVVKSSQAYYAAEAGIEDILLRLTKDKNWSSSHTFNVGDALATVITSDIIGGARILTSEGDDSNRLRKIQIVYQVTTNEISFYFGAQVGDGGMEMGNNARVAGNIFSNGSVTPAKGGDKGYIDDAIIVAKNGNRIEGLIVGGDARAHTCKDSTIDGSLTYVSGGSIENCTAGESIKEQLNEINPKDLPILPSQLDEWKTDAENGGVIDGDYTVSGKIEVSLGPQKFTGNLLIDNNATLNMTGTIWVVGDLRIDNGATIKLDQASYGSNSGVIVVDGKIKIRPNTHLKGSGEEGSYLLLISSNSEVLDVTSPAIDVDNNTDAAIFYTTQGLIVLRNKMQAREVTGYKVFLDNNAEIAYEAGLQETTFTSGPGGSWEVSSWKEIE